MYDRIVNTIEKGINIFFFKKGVLRGGAQYCQRDGQTFFAKCATAHHKCSRTPLQKLDQQTNLFSYHRMEVQIMEEGEEIEKTKRMEETQRKELMNLTTRLKDMEEKWEMLYQQHQQVDILDPRS